MGFHRRPAQPGIDRGTRVTVLSAAAVTAAAALGTTPVGAAPQDKPSEVRAQVDRLYEQAEKATEAFNEADERADRLRAQVERARDSVARGQERINRMRGRLGALAGAQYREGGIDPSLQLMLSSDPDGYLDKATALDRVSTRHAGQLTELRRAQRGLAQQRTEAGHKLTELEKSRALVARHKRAVEHKLAQARRLLNSLPSKDREAYERSSRTGSRAEAPEPKAAAPSSSRAAAAIAAARSAVGRPYVWGANGPTASTARASPSGRTPRPGSVCRAPRRPSGTPDGRCRWPRRSPATSSPTATTPATSGCTWATARWCTPPTPALRSATTPSA